MILEYKITDTMISSIASISEKVGRLKEIRRSNRHIDFDKACTINNIQRILKEKNLIYPDKVISDAFSLGSSIGQKNAKSIFSIIESHATHLTNKELDINTYAEAYNSNKYFEEIPTWKLDRIIERTDFSPQFFLYSLADFCKECNNLTPDYFIEGWLINRFYKEYGVILSFTYSDYLKEQKEGNNLFEMFPEILLHANLSRYELFLSVIDILLDKCVEYYYELSNPKSDRVELLRGIIKEPFSWKGYLAYYKLSGSTASKDLKEAIEKGILLMKGDKIKRAFELDKDNKYIPFLVLREINKLEDWIITPLFYGKYSITNSDPFRCAYYSEWLEEYKKNHPEEYKSDEEESRLQQENLITDMKYISQLKAVLSNMFSRSSGEIKDFYAISLAHLSLLEENTSDAQKYMSMISDKANPSILLQKKVGSIWLAIKTQNIESDKFKDYFVKNISDLERISMPNFDNNKMLFTISLSLANEYLKRDNRVYGNLFRLKADWYNNKESDWYSSYSRNGDSYYTTLYFDINATISDMDILIRLLEKPNKTPFEELLCDQSLSSANAYKELKGTIAFRNNDLKLAYTTFASMPQDYWQRESFSFNSYLNEDPFVPKGLKADKYRSFDYKFNKTDFIKELIELEEKASQKDEKSSDYYNRLGDAYFNTTYWGNSWMMTRYSWSSNDRDYSKIDCLPEWMRNYMTAGTARRYYEKALEKAVNEEQKAYATVMLRYIHYLNFSFRSQDYDKTIG